jgi:hypothetical protein
MSPTDISAYFKILKRYFAWFSKLTKKEMFQVLQACTCMAILLITYFVHGIYKTHISYSLAPKIHSTIDIVPTGLQRLSTLQNKYCQDQQCYFIDVHLNPYEKTFKVTGAIMTAYDCKNAMFGKGGFNVPINIAGVPIVKCDRANCDSLNLTEEDWEWLNSFKVKPDKLHEISFEELQLHRSFAVALTDLKEKNIEKYVFSVFKDEAENIFWITAIAIKKGNKIFRGDMKNVISYDVIDHSTRLGRDYSALFSTTNVANPFVRQDKPHF